MVLDGEIVVFDENGNPDFQKLQYYSHYEHLPMYYYVFDILQYKGKNVMSLPLMERKALLSKVLPKNDVIRYCDHVENDGITFFRSNAATQFGRHDSEAENQYICTRRTY